MRPNPKKDKSARRKRNKSGVIWREDYFQIWHRQHEVSNLLREKLGLQPAEMAKTWRGMPIPEKTSQET